MPVVSLLLFVGLSGPIGAAAAHAASSDPRQIVPGAVALGGSVVGPGLSAPREISADDAGGFMQSWLSYSFFGHPRVDTPPKSAALYHVTVRQRFANHTLNLTVLYAKKGANAWVGMPAQSLGWAFVSSEKWIVAPPTAIAAFKNLVGDLPSASPTTSGGRQTSSSDGTSAWVWIASIGGALIIVLAVALVLRRRARK
jgi:hypothetical protein